MGARGVIEVPEDDWFCPTCKPPERRNHSNKSLKDVSDSADDEDEDESEEEGDLCEVCNETGADDMVTCESCFNSYHIHCVKPPLRTVPKLTWTCHSCRNGGKSKQTRVEKVVEETSSADDAEDSLTTTSSRRIKPSKSTRSIPRRGTRNASIESSSEDDELVYRRSSRTQTTPTNTRAVESPVKSSGSDSEVELNIRPTKAKTSLNSCIQKKNTQQGKDKSSGSKGRLRAASKKVSSDSENPSAQKGRESLATIDSFFKVKKPQTPERQLEACKTMLRKLMACRFSWPFDKPVDESEVPDYYTVIKDPIDLQLIRGKLDNSEYDSAADFIKDFSRLLFNSFDYNSKGDQISLLTQKLEDYFHTLVTRHLPELVYEKQQCLFGYTDN